MYSFAPTRGWGLGDVASDQKAAGIAASVAGSAVSAAAAAGLIAGAAVPFIGPAIAVVAIAVEALIANSGCGITCVETSQWANQAEPLLKQNIAAYFAQPAPRSQSNQALALQTFDKVWATLTAQCSQPGTGDAGKRCISDRDSGACTWKQTATSPLLSYPGEPQPGECWNWYSGYRDPIANDPDVMPDEMSSASSSSASGSFASLLTGGSSDMSSLLLPALLLGAGVAVYLAVSK